MNGRAISGLGGWLAATPRGVVVLALVAAAGLRAGAAPEGLVQHFDFDKEPADGVIADQSGKKNDGKLAGAKWVQEGKNGGGIECKPGQGGVTVAGGPTLDLKKATLAAWIKVPKAQGQQRLVLGRGGLRLVIDGEEKSRGKLALEMVGGPRCVSDEAVTNGAWHFAAATYDGAQMKLYVDGKPQQQVVACTAAIAAEPAGLLIGMNPPGPDGKAGSSLEGLLDEVMVFNRALSADEISGLGSAIDPKIVVPARKFTKGQILGQIKQLNSLYEEGLLENKYYTRKVRELEALVGEE